MSTQEIPDKVVPVTAPAIFLAEDDLDEALLFRRALERNDIRNPLVHVSDGEAAVRWFQRCLEGKIAPPAVTILDVKMPRLSGFDVLSWLRLQPEFAKLPVVMLSNSAQVRDIERSVLLGASDYLQKPAVMNDFVALVGELNERWVRSGAMLTCNRGAK